jgi:putative spermidine/putrescine transport system ATP-binding protein
VVAVDALDLDVQKGELIGFLGPSGCGKSTTLWMVGGLTPNTSGRVLLNGSDITAVPSHRRNMGIVFQSYALFPHMSVAQNVAFGLEMRGVPRKDIEARVNRMLGAVHLDSYGRRRTQQLSGGQQQRVALARALAIEPELLLLDEPLSNLDAKLREAMRAEIRQIQREFGITTIFVTHDQSEALSICDRIVVMREGRLEQIGTPFDLYERPATAFVAEFVGRINRMAAERQNSNEVRVAGEIVARLPGASGPLTAMIRPHRVAIGISGSRASDRAGTSGTVSAVTYIGDVVQYEVATAAGKILAELPTSGEPPSYSPGDAVDLGWRAQDLLVFQQEAVAS